VVWPDGVLIHEGHEAHEDVRTKKIGTPSDQQQTAATGRPLGGHGRDTVLDRHRGGSSAMPARHRVSPVPALCAPAVAHPSCPIFVCFVPFVIQHSVLPKLLAATFWGRLSSESYVYNLHR
jgi:hypothetical protein